MSLAIDTDQITDVLLDDGWHHVADQTFDIDSYEYLYWSRRQCKDNDDPVIVHGGGHSGICPGGFIFQTGDGDWIAGPLTAVRAVRHTRNQCLNPECGHEEVAA